MNVISLTGLTLSDPNLKVSRLCSYSGHLMINLNLWRIIEEEKGGLNYGVTFLFLYKSSRWREVKCKFFDMVLPQ